MARADRITPNDKSKVIYSDFRFDFAPHPLSGDLAILTNEDAVRESIKNAILTSIGSRPFSDFGSKVRTVLFDLVDDINSELIYTTIKNSIENHESGRVIIEEITVVASPNKNEYFVKVVFTTTTSATPVVLDVILKRVR